jgi:hypothetical protein
MNHREDDRLTALSVQFAQPPTGMGPVTTAARDDTSGTLIGIATDHREVTPAAPLAFQPRPRYDRCWRPGRLRTAERAEPTWSPGDRR